MRTKDFLDIAQIRMRIEGSLHPAQSKIRIESSLDPAQLRIKTKGFLNPQCVPKTDQGRRIIGKSFDRLGRPMHKFAKSVSETSIKVRKPLTYNEA